MAGFGSAIGRVLLARAAAICVFVLVAELTVILGLIDQPFAVFLHVEFMNIGEYDRVHRTGFFAKTTIDAFKQVDIVARGAALAVLPLLRSRW